jgi:hypothetical protein
MSTQVGVEAHATMTQQPTTPAAISLQHGYFRLKYGTLDLSLDL